MRRALLVAVAINLTLLLGIFIAHTAITNMTSSGLVPLQPRSFIADLEIQPIEVEYIDAHTRVGCYWLTAMQGHILCDDGFEPLTQDSIHGRYNLYFPDGIYRTRGPLKAGQ
jgi:hypothetical protein